MLGDPALNCSELGQAAPGYTFAWVITKLVLDHTGHDPPVPTARWIPEHLRKQATNLASHRAPNKLIERINAEQGLELGKTTTRLMVQQSFKRAVDPSSLLNSIPSARYVNMYKHTRPGPAGEEVDVSYRIKAGPSVSSIAVSKSLSECDVHVDRTSTSVATSSRPSVQAMGDADVVDITEATEEKEYPEDEERGHLQRVDGQHRELMAQSTSSTVIYSGTVFTTVFSMEYAYRFHEAYSVDPTAGTNSQHKAFVTVTGIDFEGRSFAAAWALLDGETQESYVFLFQALRILLGRDWMYSIRAISTDGDAQLISVLDTYDLGFHKGRSRFRDFWHLVVKKFKESYLRADLQDGGVGSTALAWIKNIAYQLETAEEVKISSDKLLEYLQQQKDDSKQLLFDDSKYQQLYTVVSGILTETAHFSFASRFKVPTINVFGTTRSEGENSAIKSIGSVSLATSINNVVMNAFLLESDRLRRNKVEALVASTKTPSPESLYSQIIVARMKRRERFKLSRSSPAVVTKAAMQTEEWKRKIEALANDVPLDEELLTALRSYPELYLQISIKCRKLIEDQVICSFPACEVNARRQRAYTSAVSSS